MAMMRIPGRLLIWLTPAQKDDCAINAVSSLLLLMLHGRYMYAKRDQDATESNPYHLNKFDYLRILFSDALEN